MKISIKQAVATVLMAAVPALSALAAAPQGVADAGTSGASGSAHNSTAANRPTQTPGSRDRAAGGRFAATPRAAASTTPDVVPDPPGLPVIPDFADLTAIPDFGGLPVIPDRRDVEDQLRYGRSPFDAQRTAAEKAWIDSFDSIIPPGDQVDIDAIVNGR